jgi:hypothetical protein
MCYTLLPYQIKDVTLFRIKLSAESPSEHIPPEAASTSSCRPTRAEHIEEIRCSMWLFISAPRRPDKGVDHSPADPARPKPTALY